MFLYLLKSSFISGGFGSGSIGLSNNPIIPNNSDYLKEIISPNSYLEANNLDSFVDNSLIIIKNYEKFLSHAKSSSKNLFQSIKKDFLIKNISKL